MKKVAHRSLRKGHTRKWGVGGSFPQPLEVVWVPSQLMALRFIPDESVFSDLDPGSLGVPDTPFLLCPWLSVATALGLLVPGRLPWGWEGRAAGGRALGPPLSYLVQVTPGPTSTSPLWGIFKAARVRMLGPSPGPQGQPAGSEMGGLLRVGQSGALTDGFGIFNFPFLYRKTLIMALCKWHDYVEKLTRQLLVREEVSRGGGGNSSAGRGFWGAGEGVSGSGACGRCSCGGASGAGLCGEEPHLHLPAPWGLDAVAGVWLQAAGTVQMQDGRLGR